MDPDIPQKKRWVHKGPLSSHSAAQKDSSGQFFIPAYKVCPLVKDSDLESDNFYHNPTDDWAYWCNEIINIVLSNEDSSLLTMRDYTDSPSAQLLDCIQIIKTELNIMRSSIRKRKEDMAKSKAKAPGAKR